MRTRRLREAMSNEATYCAPERNKFKPPQRQPETLERARFRRLHYRLTVDTRISAPLVACKARSPSLEILPLRRTHLIDPLQ